ncbi:hypothetical protein [Desulfosarcina ovata]|uniref:Uncharacterized protein n=1 Tax=Desulfosarcina ovata subsp. ovata TaxID=2752305 RepID=A0A5K8AME0_9BACT|nr:hypothetical protein [Desulfosarcina ovata]BBO93000.1 hypothetical protein DSCOOX_61800 [Desulfosarcina ovata subsp. ovata]
MQIENQLAWWEGVTFLIDFLGRMTPPGGCLGRITTGADDRLVSHLHHSAFVEDFFSV